MTTQHIAAALRRVEAAVRRRPDVAMHEESPATAREKSYDCSQTSAAMRDAVPVALQVDIAAA